MKSLSHKFWLWVARKIEQHQFLESIQGDYPLKIDIDKSVPNPMPHEVRIISQETRNKIEEIIKGYEKNV